MKRLSTVSNSPSESVSPPPTAFWKRVATTVFSFPVMCMFLLAGLIFAYSARGIAEPDIWWHLRNAQQLFVQHSFPRVNTYSFTAAGSPWLNFEWLSDIPYFLAFKTGGLKGILVVYYALLVLIFTTVYYRALHAGADCKNATVATVMAIFLGIGGMGPRTFLFGWLCMSGLLLILDHFQRTGRGLWLLPPLFALWINLHGSWAFGIVVLAITIVSGSVEGKWGLVVARRWSRVELRNLLLVSAASLAALLVNPFGYKLPLYPFELLFYQQSAMAYVNEWQSVNFSKLSGKLALIAIFSLLSFALFSRRRWRLYNVLLIALALWAGLSHVRFLFFVGLILAPILAPRLKLFPPYQHEVDKPWLNAGIMAAVVGSILLFFPSNVKLQQQVDEQYQQPHWSSCSSGILTAESLLSMVGVATWNGWRLS